MQHYLFICTIAKPRPFHYPAKIRNVIKGRNSQRRLAARRICRDFQLLGKHTDFAEFLVAVVKQGRNIYP